MSLLAEYIGDCALVAHNSAYDAKLIINEMNRCGIPLNPCLAGLAENNTKAGAPVEFVIKTSENNEGEKQVIGGGSGVVCTMMVARRLIPSLEGGYSLGNLQKYFKFPEYKMHRAISDTQMTAMIWKQLYVESCKRLGFSPSLEFFVRLCEQNVKDTEKFITEYKIYNKPNA